MKDELEWPIWLPEGAVSAPCRDLVAHMLVKDPAQRATLADVQAHPWFVAGPPPPAAEAAQGDDEAPAPLRRQSGWPTQSEDCIRAVVEAARTPGAVRTADGIPSDAVRGRCLDSRMAERWQSLLLGAPAEPPP